MLVTPPHEKIWRMQIRLQSLMSIALTEQNMQEIYTARCLAATALYRFIAKQQRCN